VIKDSGIVYSEEEIKEEEEASYITSTCKISLLLTRLSPLPSVVTKISCNYNTQYKARYSFLTFLNGCYKGVVSTFNTEAFHLVTNVQIPSTITYVVIFCRLLTQILMKCSVTRTKPIIVIDSVSVELLHSLTKNAWNLFNWSYRIHSRECPGGCIHMCQLCALASTHLALGTMSVYENYKTTNQLVY